MVLYKLTPTSSKDSTHKAAPDVRNKLLNLQDDVQMLPACQALAIASADQPSSHSPLEVGVVGSPNLLLFLQPPLQLFAPWLLALEPFCQGLPNLSVLRPVCQSAASG